MGAKNKHDKKERNVRSETLGSRNIFEQVTSVRAKVDGYFDDKVSILNVTSLSLLFTFTI